MAGKIRFSFWPIKDYSGKKDADVGKGDEDPLPMEEASLAKGQISTREWVRCQEKTGQTVSSGHREDSRPLHLNKDDSNKTKTSLMNKGKFSMVISSPASS